MSNSDEEELLLLLLLRNSRKETRCWVLDTNKKRDKLGEYHCLCIALQSHEDRFFKYFPMSRDCFEEMHHLIFLYHKMPHIKYNIKFNILYYITYIS